MLASQNVFYLKRHENRNDVWDSSRRYDRHRMRVSSSDYDKQNDIPRTSNWCCQKQKQSDIKFSTNCAAYLSSGIPSRYLISNIRYVISNVKDDQSRDNCKINDRQRQNWSVRVNRSLNPHFAAVRRGLNLLLPPTLEDMPMISLSPFTWHRHDHHPLRRTSSTCCDDPREKIRCAIVT